MRLKGDGWWCWWCSQTNITRSATPCANGVIFFCPPRITKEIIWGCYVLGYHSTSGGHYYRGMDYPLGMLWIKEGNYKRFSRPSKPIVCWGPPRPNIWRPKCEMVERASNMDTRFHRWAEKKKILYSGRGQRLEASGFEWRWGYIVISSLE